jgi:hypothetical protein
VKLGHDPKRLGYGTHRVLPFKRELCRHVLDEMPTRAPKQLTGWASPKSSKRSARTIAQRERATVRCLLRACFLAAAT